MTQNAGNSTTTNRGIDSSGRSGNGSNKGTARLASAYARYRHRSIRIPGEHRDSTTPTTNASISQ